MPLTLPAGRLHTCEKFMYQLPSIFLPFLLRITLRAVNLLVHLSLWFFKSDLFRRRKQGVGYRLLKLWWDFWGRAPCTGIALLCAFATCWLRDKGKAGEDSWGMLWLQAMCWKAADLLRHEFQRASNNNSLVNLHLSVFVLAKEGGVVGFLIPWVKYQLSHCKTVMEMRKFSVSAE